MPPLPPQKLIRGRCSCGQAYRIRDPGPDAKVLCPTCGRVLKLRQIEFSISTGPIRTKWQQADQTPQMAVLRDHGELNLAPQGARLGLTGEKIYTNQESRLLGAQNQWPEGWSLLDRPAEVAQSDWLASGPPVKRGWALDLLASVWCAGAPRNVVSLAGLAACWLVAWPILESIARPGNASLCLVVSVMGPLALAVAVLTSRHLGLTVRDTMLGEDDVIWTRDGGQMWRDFLGPALGFGIAVGLCYGPFWLIGLELPDGGGSHPGYVAFSLVLAALLLPLALLTLLGASSGLAWRPDAAVRNFLRLWPEYLVPWLAGLAAGGVCYWVWNGGLAVWTAPLPPLPERAAGFLLCLYAGYVYARTVGLLARLPGRNLEGLYTPRPE